MATVKKKYIKIRMSPKTSVGKINKWLNRKGLTGWELFATFRTTRSNGWDVYHFRKPTAYTLRALKSKHLKK